MRLREWNQNSSYPPGKSRQAEGARRLPAPSRAIGVWGSASQGQTPEPSNPSVQELEPSIKRRPVRMTHPCSPHLSPRAPFGGDEHQARPEDAALRRGGGSGGWGRPSLWLWAAAGAEAAADPPRRLPDEIGSNKQKSPAS